MALRLNVLSIVPARQPSITLMDVQQLIGGVGDRAPRHVQGDRSKGRRSAVARDRGSGLADAVPCAGLGRTGHTSCLRRHGHRGARSGTQSGDLTKARTSANDPPSPAHGTSSGRPGLKSGAGGYAVHRYPGPSPANLPIHYPVKSKTFINDKRFAAFPARRHVYPVFRLTSN